MYMYVHMSAGTCANEITRGRKRHNTNLHTEMVSHMIYKVKVHWKTMRLLREKERLSGCEKMVCERASASVNIGWPPFDTIRHMKRGHRGGRIFRAQRAPALCRREWDMGNPEDVAAHGK